MKSLKEIQKNEIPMFKKPRIIKVSFFLILLKGSTCIKKGDEREFKIGEHYLCRRRGKMRKAFRLISFHLI